MAVIFQNNMSRHLKITGKKIYFIELHFLAWKNFSYNSSAPLQNALHISCPELGHRFKPIPATGKQNRSTMIELDQLGITIILE